MSKLVPFIRPLIAGLVIAVAGLGCVAPSCVFAEECCAESTVQQEAVTYTPRGRRQALFTSEYRTAFYSTPLHDLNGLDQRWAVSNTQDDDRVPSAHFLIGAGIRIRC